MKRMGATQARSNWADVLDRVVFGRERVIIGRRSGKQTVAIVPMEDLELLRRIEDALDARAAQEALDEMAGTPGTSWDEFRKGTMASGIGAARRFPRLSSSRQ